MLAVYPRDTAAATPGSDRKARRRAHAATLAADPGCTLSLRARAGARTVPRATRSVTACAYAPGKSRFPGGLSRPRHGCPHPKREAAASVAVFAPATGIVQSGIGRLQSPYPGFGLRNDALPLPSRDLRL